MNANECLHAGEEWRECDRCLLRDRTEKLSEAMAVSSSLQSVLAAVADIAAERSEGSDLLKMMASIEELCNQSLGCSPKAFLCDCGEGRDHIENGFPWCLKNKATTGAGLVDCEVCRIFGDSNLLLRSATPINSVDDEMVVRALEALAPQAVTNRYGYSKGYRVRDILAEEDYEATLVMRAALEAAIGREVVGNG